MSIILISSDSAENGEEISRKTAQALDYTYLGRELLSTVAAKYHVDEAHLQWALDSFKGVRGRAARRQRQYLAFVQAATLGKLVEDNVVCYGLGAHLYIHGVSHALKVRITTDSNKQAEKRSAQEGMALEKALEDIGRFQETRRNWSLNHFGIDETDPSQYDLSISLDQISVDEAIDIVTKTAGYRRFTPMTYSIRCLKDIELASRVRAALLEGFPEVNVTADRGTVVVETKGSRSNRMKKIRAIRKQVGTIKGVDYVEVHVKNGLFRRLVSGYR